MSRISANLRKNKQNKKGDFYLKKSSSHFFRKSKRSQMMSGDLDSSNQKTFSRLHKNFMSKQSFNANDKKKDTMMKLKKTKSHSSGFNHLLNTYSTDKRSGLKIKNLKNFLAKKPKLSFKKSSTHVSNSG